MKKHCLVAALAVAVALAAVALLGGCGGGSDAEAGSDEGALSETMGVSLDSRIGPANVGIGLAEQHGHFEDAGLDVWSGSPAGVGKPGLYVASGIDDFGVTQLPQLLIAREKGMPLVAVGSLLSQPTASMIWLKKSQIGGIADLRGKTVGIPGLPYQEGFLVAVLRRAGLTLDDVEVKRVGYNLVSALLGGRVDATFGGSWNIEGAALEARGAEPVVKRVQDLGLPSYDELVVITREELVAEEPELVRDFISVVAGGIAAAKKDPEAAVEIIEDSIESSPELSRKETEAGVEATLPLLSTSSYIDPAQASELVDWMYEEGLTQARPAVSEVLTNDFLESP